jgi:hypothetical protein
MSGSPEEQATASALTVELRPDGPGGTLRERYAHAVNALANVASLEVVGLVVEMRPAGTSPGPIALRLALKRLRRTCGLRAVWSRPPPRPARKRKTRQRCNGGQHGPAVGAAQAVGDASPGAAKLS